MTSNPYLEARRDWDERYADLVLGKRNWQVAAAGLLLLSLVLAGSNVWLVRRSRFVPYVVEVDRLGYGLTVPKPLIPSSEPALVDRMERYEVASFIRNSRSVSGDPATEQHMLDDMLAHAKAAADKYLDEYFHSENFAHNPFKIAEHQTVSVQIDSILELSEHSFQVRWTEQARDPSGVVSRPPTHWEAALKTQIVPPSSDEAIVSNPLGFYVTQLSWAQQQS